MSRDYCTPGPPFLYAGGEPGSGMDCLHPQLRHPHLQHHHHHSGAGVGSNVVVGGSGPGPFHHLIHEQAKSLVALQELQHEVGALLEFRDLVIETFPSLRTKMAAAAVAAAAAAASTPATMMLMSGGSSGGSASNIPVAIRRSEWEPGIQVRRKLITSIGSSSKDAKKSESTIQDSGFSTETSSKDTHSSAASANSSSQAGAGGSSSDTDHSDDELWNLLDVIHRKGMRLKDEVEALQGTLHNQSNFREEEDFQRYLFHGSADDLRVLRQERDHLLDRLSSMEAEVMASRLHTSRLQEDFEQLLVAKMALEDQLQSVLNQRGEVNSRIHDLHVQFVADSTRQVLTDGSTVRVSEKDQTVPSVPITNSVGKNRTNSASRLSRTAGVSALDLVLGDSVPKVKLTDSGKVAAILKEKNPLVLQKHLLTSTVKNQVLQEQLETVSKHEEGLADKLDKARVENDELKFQLKDKHIELEGTLARVRMLELHTRTTPAQNSVHTSITKSPDIIPQSEQSVTASPVVGDRDRSMRSRTEITTASMKAMSPYPPLLLQGLDHSSSTESAHDHQQQQEQQGKDMQSSRSVTRRKPSKIPLVKSHPAPKPPGSNASTPQSTATTPRSRSGGDTPITSRTSTPPTWRLRATHHQQPPPSLTKSTGSLYAGNKSRPGSLTKDSVISHGSSHSSNGRAQYRKTTSPGVRRANTTATNGDAAAKVRHRFSWRSWFPNINGP